MVEGTMAGKFWAGGSEMWLWPHRRQQEDSGGAAVVRGAPRLLFPACVPGGWVVSCAVRK